MYRVNAIGHNQRWPLVTFSQEISQRAVERTRQPYDFSRLSYQRKRALNLTHRFKRTIEDSFPSLLNSHVSNPIYLGVGEVNNAFKVLVRDWRVHGGTIAFKSLKLKREVLRTF